MFDTFHFSVLTCTWQVGFIEAQEFQQHGILGSGELVLCIGFIGRGLRVIKRGLLGASHCLFYHFKAFTEAGLLLYQHYRILK
jgi:hypothetical protein